MTESLRRGSNGAVVFALNVFPALTGCWSRRREQHTQMRTCYSYVTPSMDMTHRLSTMRTTRTGSKPSRKAGESRTSKIYHFTVETASPYFAATASGVAEAPRPRRLIRTNEPAPLETLPCVVPGRVPVRNNMRPPRLGHICNMIAVFPLAVSQTDCRGNPDRAVGWML